MKEFWLLGQPYLVGVLVSALVAFGATFAGVFTSFWKENKRHRQEERSGFGKLIKNVLIELGNYSAVLHIVVQTATEGRIVPHYISANSLQTALINPLTYTYAPYSLITVMTFTSMYLAQLNNILVMHLMGGSVGRAPDETNIEELKDIARKCERLINEVLLPEIELLLPQFGGKIQLDDRSEQVDEKMKIILQSKM